MQLFCVAVLFVNYKFKFQHLELKIIMSEKSYQGSDKTKKFQHFNKKYYK